MINDTDGKRFGRIIDIVFGASDGRILGIVVPHFRRNIIFRNSEPIFIHWECVEKIGEDIILVHMIHNSFDRPLQHRRRHVASIASLDMQEDVDYSLDNLEQEDESHLEGRNQIGHSKHAKEPTRQTASGHYSSLHASNNQSKRHPNSISTQSNTLPDSNKPHFRPGIDCDNKCSKCMLFDCSYRWNNEGQ